MPICSECGENKDAKCFSAAQLKKKDKPATDTLARRSGATVRSARASSNSAAAVGEAARAAAR